ncbi:MAG: S26 family signal peptidase [Planctomycetota bacterium]
MAPTLRGASLRWSCDKCDVSTLTSQLQIRELAEQGRAIVCFNCGSRHRVDESQYPPVNPDVVRIVPINDQTTVQRGQVVVVTREGKFQVKRVAAIPGDRVSLDLDVLQVNGESIATPAIDGGAHDRSITLFELTPRTLERLQRREKGWFLLPPNAYRDSRRESWLDDTPYNVGVSRRLNSIDQVKIEFDKPLRWQFDRRLTILEDLPREQLLGLKVYRPIIHRLNQIHRRDGYPLKLMDHQFFLVGDNAPVSVDSRDWGPVDGGALKYRVVGIERPSE